MYAQGFTVLVMMAVAALELTDAPQPKKTMEMTDQWKAILAKDNQGNYIVKDTAAVAAAAASLSTPSTSSA